MGVAIPAVSPWVQEFSDYLGRVIRITVTFDTVTRILAGVTVFRDPACLFTRILIGIGPTGTPDSSTRVFDVPSGTTVLNPAQMTAVRNNGMNTIENMQAFQITAGLPL